MKASMSRSDDTQTLREYTIRCLAWVCMWLLGWRTSSVEKTLEPVRPHGPFIANRTSGPNGPRCSLDRDLHRGSPARVARLAGSYARGPPHAAYPVQLAMTHREPKNNSFLRRSNAE